MAVNIAERIEVYKRLMRTDRPIGTYLVVWPMLWALWIAGSGHPDAYIVAVFLMGAFLMRSAGCVINDFADRKIDGHVERTRERPMAKGEIRSREALALFAVLALIAFLLVLTMNRLTIELAFAALALAVVYPFMKRFTHLPQVFLGAAFAWSIPMAFAAVGETVPAIAWILFAATILWVVAYDTMYAMVDREDDLKLGVKSTAILFGRHDRLIIGLLQLAMFALLAVAGFKLSLGVPYYGGLLAAAGLAVYQQQLIRDRERQACFQAFLNNHYLGALIFFGLFFDYALTGMLG
ncbi:MAG TPA: 4-hydroxybenzoate octaprenyltransferase [Mariprofundaceae bacterium]|nr:4-hydroxybenzoate octaprenyltransferase [Mariprofundaceae bacterium]